MRTGSAAIVCLVLIATAFLIGPDWKNPMVLFDTEHRAILEVRFWRWITGCMIGASLGIAGAVFQALLRNPLAEPYVLGVSSGAGLGLAAVLMTGLSAASILWQPLGGFIGAILSLLAVWRLARLGRSGSTQTLVLAGVVWASLCGSILMFLVSQSSREGMHALLWWFLGDLQPYDTRLTVLIAGLHLLAVLFIFWHARTLNALLLGDEAASHLGLRVERARFGLLLAASLLAAGSVTLAGIIGFVGLVIPHIGRALAGSDHRRLLPFTALAGAAFLSIADGVGRTLLYPVETPASIFTAFIGAPFFLLLLTRKKADIWS